MDLCREKKALPAGSGESAGEGMLCVLKSSFGSCSPTLEFSFLWKLSHESNVLVEMSHLLAVDMCFL